jgi:lipoprotein-anchoring transpeptidase ErfK/SrfK
MLNPQISRREFLKLASTGSLAFALKDLRLDRSLSAALPWSATPAALKQGRITFSGMPLYDAPTFRATQIHNFGMDKIIEIASIDENGEQGNPFNSTWYQVDQGFTYSGWVQPVETNYQKPIFNIPEKGQVGEITVPFTDTKRDPFVYAERGYRVFYGSTHWVKRVIVQRDEKSIWYEIYDFYLKENRYIASHDMRLIPNDELTTLSPEVPDEEKHIVVDLSTQLVTAFEGEKLVFSQRCSSGVKGTDTPKGEFRTYHKGASVHMTNEGDAIEEETVYSLPGVPWCSFFTGAGNAFHGTWWHNDYGRPRSHGCVNLPSEAAKFLYRWTKPNVPPDTDYLHLPGEGTNVQVF